MANLNLMSRGYKALLAARQAVEAKTVVQIMNRLTRHPCVSFVVQCGSSFDSGSDLDIAVRMLLAEAYGHEIYDGRLRHDLATQWIRSESVSAANLTVVECVSILESCSLPFAFLSHIHGQTFPQFVFGNQSGKEALQEIADALAQEISVIP